MDNKTAKEVLHKLMVKIVDNGSATINLGTDESAAIRALIYPTKK
jgi:hypothetical protein